ncbi:MAG: hypothetical protein JSR17_02080 [Proteobacteria bacterium]|nr:hypothetical protein [Pseudomonadota bacterium]
MKLFGFLKQNLIALLILILFISGIAVAFYLQQTILALGLVGALILALGLVMLALCSSQEQAPATIEKAPSPKETDDKAQALFLCEQNLKDVQQQLVIQEKLASVGMLAAGIAHEIKNPLNFINNFADMTVELLDELKAEIDKPLQTTDEETKQAVNSIIEDIVVNCKKINEHGKRAESIIKNMLIQARSSEVEKAPLDVNALLEEYLNLSYHGMRAQNNKVNVKIEKFLDKTIKPLTVDQQSIGRVFLNIINNGLYAANEKAQTADPSFMPTISIASEQDETFVTIKIKDNGNGIPESIRQKIFEPFFTTKPAGQGTGLGLPICYDIVVKEHQGKLEVNSVSGQFTEFIIKLPKNIST